MNDLTHLDNLEEKINQVTVEQWGKCFEIIPLIELAITRLKFLPENLKHTAFEPQLIEFIENDELNSMGIVPVFDFRKWNKGKEILNDNEFEFDSLDLKTLCMLFTPIFRINKYYSGFLERQMANGNMLKILKAIQKKVNAKN